MAPTVCKSTSPEAGIIHASCRYLAGVAALTLVLPALAQAQDRPDARGLDDLIPDAAVADPERWAAEGVEPNGARDLAAEGTDDGDSSPDIAFDTPLAAMPLITVPWPEEQELAEIEPLEPAAEPIEFATFEDEIERTTRGTERRLSDQLVIAFPADREMFPEQDEFVSRFESLSTIGMLEAGDNQARLAAQARADEELLQRLLRIYGYFDAQVIRSVGGTDAGDDSADDTPTARFEIVPGARYQVASVDLGDLSATGDDYEALRQTYEVFPGDPVSLDAIENERFDLDGALGQSGYPFAEIEAPELLVDHEALEGAVTMPVAPGGRYVFGEVVSDKPDFLPSRHLARIARFEPGDLYQRDDQLDLRRAILATGLVGSVTVTPVEVVPPQGDQPGTVDLEVGMTQAPLRTLTGELGYGTQEGFRIGGSWEHRNLFPPEGSLRIRGLFGTQQQLAGVTLRRNNFRGRDRILSLDTFVSTIDFPAYDARTISAVATYERVSNLLFQKPFTWSMGLELVATQEAERDAQGVRGVRDTFLVAALPLFAQLDTSNDLLDPTSGWRLSGRLSPEISDSGGVQSFYVRNQVDASYYRQVTESVVMAGRVRLASIPGADVSAIAPSRRLYAGGGGSVRGYGFREIGPLNDSGDPIGGRSLVEFSLEARIQTGFMDGAISVVPFVDAGSVGNEAVPDFDTIKYGAGVGIRYDTGFGPLRVDVATPINPGPNDTWIAVYVALGQAF